MGRKQFGAKGYRIGVMKVPEGLRAAIKEYYGLMPGHIVHGIRMMEFPFSGHVMDTAVVHITGEDGIEFTTICDYDGNGGTPFNKAGEWRVTEHDFCYTEDEKEFLEDYAREESEGDYGYDGSDYDLEE